MTHLLCMISAAVAMAGDLSREGAEERAIVKSVEIAAPVAEVWKAWTTGEGLESFFAPSATVELRMGGRYEALFLPNAPEGLRGTDGCTVLGYVPERMLSFTWNAPPSFPSMRNMRTFVVLLFEPAGQDATRLELRHAGWGAPREDADVFAYFDKVWDAVLAACQRRFAEGPRVWPEVADGAGGRNDVALEKLAAMIGGTWRGEVRDPEGKPVPVEFTYSRHADGKGLVGEGVIGKGSASAVIVTNRFGWDPVARAVYYFDSHNSDTLYFGHVAMDGDDFVFTFGALGGPPAIYRSRGRLEDDDTYSTILTGPGGEEIVAFTLKRVR
jgi:uncharacterized protein YndB with AHSA1/START domain